MKIIVAFRLATRANDGLAADCWLEFSKFVTRDGRSREYQVEADLLDDARVSLVDAIGDITGELRGVVQSHRNAIERIVAVHAVRGD